MQKESLAQVFSCEFCEIPKNTFFHRTPLVAASGLTVTVCFQKNEYFKNVNFVILFTGNKL